MSSLHSFTFLMFFKSCCIYCASAPSLHNDSLICLWSVDRSCHLHVISSGSATSIVLISDDSSQKPEELQTRPTNSDPHHSSATRSASFIRNPIRIIHPQPDPHHSSATRSASFIRNPIRIIQTDSKGN